MAWQRKVPFGYAIQNGEFVCNDTEAGAVRAIYAMYRSGSTYSQIAVEMERQGIPYHAHTPHWNKHMVKRILENQRYLGRDGYPQLVPDEDYRAVDHQRASKTSYAPCPVSIPPIRKKAVCGLCGARMIRDTRNRHPRWLCQNPECGHRSFIKDAALEKQIDQHLQELAQVPHLLIRMEKTQISPAPSDALRIQNELTHALNRGETDIEYMKALVFAIAAEQYKAIPDPIPQLHLEQLRKRLEQRPPDADDLHELFDTVVQAVQINSNQITLRLTDGMLFGKIDGKERTA